MEEKKLNTAIRSDGSGLMKKFNESDSRTYRIEHESKRIKSAGEKDTWERSVGLRGRTLELFFLEGNKKYASAKGFLFLSGDEEREGRRLDWGPCVCVAGWLARGTDGGGGGSAFLRLIEFCVRVTHRAQRTHVQYAEITKEKDICCLCSSPPSFLVMRNKG